MNGFYRFFVLMGLAIAAFAPATSAKAFGDYPDGHYVLGIDVGCWRWRQSPDKRNDFAAVRCLRIRILSKEDTAEATFDIVYHPTSACGQMPFGGINEPSELEGNGTRRLRQGTQVAR
jgi:hypothetical protein